MILYIIVCSTTTVLLPNRDLCLPASVSQLIAAQATKGNSKFVLLVEVAKSNCAAKETLAVHGAKVVQGLWWESVLEFSQLWRLYMLIMWVVYKNTAFVHLWLILFKPTVQVQQGCCQDFQNTEVMRQNYPVQTHPVPNSLYIIY